MQLSHSLLVALSAGIGVLTLSGCDQATSDAPNHATDSSGLSVLPPDTLNKPECLKDTIAVTDSSALHGTSTEIPGHDCPACGMG